jgi:hypothetical protein
VKTQGQESRNWGKGRDCRRGKETNVQAEKHWSSTGLHSGPCSGGSLRLQQSTSDGHAWRNPHTWLPPCRVMSQCATCGPPKEATYENILVENQNLATAHHILLRMRTYSVGESLQ